MCESTSYENAVETAVHAGTAVEEVLVRIDLPCWNVKMIPEKRVGGAGYWCSNLRTEGTGGGKWDFIMVARDTLHSQDLDK